MKNSKSALSLRAFMVVFILLGAIAVYVLAQEQITLTTYYPSPYGVYNKVRLYPHDEGSACTPGEMYYNSSGLLYMCDNTSTWAQAITTGGAGDVTFGSGDIIFGGALRSTRTDGGFMELFGNSTVNGLKWDNTWKDLGWFYNNTRAGFFDFQVQGLFANYSSNFISDGGLAILRTDDLIGVSNSSKFQAARPYQEEDLCIAVTGRTTGGTNVDGWVKQCEPAFKPWTYNSAAAQVYATNNAWSVGIGTATPGVKLDVVQPTLNNMGLRVTDGAKYIFMVPNLGAGGYNPITSAGNVGIFSTGGDMVIAPWSATTGGIKIASGGNVGVGEATPGMRLHVTGNDAAIRITDANGGGGRPGINFDNNQMAYISGRDTWAGPQYFMFMSSFAVPRVNDAVVRIYGRDPTTNWAANLELTHDGTDGYINAYNAAGALSSVFVRGVAHPSSKRWKKDISGFSDALAGIKQLRGVRFTWDKENGGKKDIGLIAEELVNVYPELVALDKDGLPAGIRDEGLIAILIEAVKDQQKQIDALKKEVQALKDKNK